MGHPNTPEPSAERRLLRNSGRLFRSALIFAGSLALVVLAARASEAPPSAKEVRQQNEFRKAYSLALNDKVARVRAFALLEGATHSSSWQLIATALNAERDHDVQDAGFTALSNMPARDPTLGKLLAQQFQALSFDDYATRWHYCKAMGNSQFKHAVVEAMATYLSRLQYPPPPPDDGLDKEGRRLADSIRRVRMYFEALLDAFNEVAESDVTKANPEAPALVLKWWQANKQKFLEADKALTEKYQAEIRAK